MDSFIHRENLALFERRLADPSLSDAQRAVILKLMREEHAKRCPTKPSREDEDPVSRLVRSPTSGPGSYSTSRVDVDQFACTASGLSDCPNKHEA